MGSLTTKNGIIPNGGGNTPYAPLWGVYVIDIYILSVNLLYFKHYKKQYRIAIFSFKIGILGNTDRNTDEC
jgi:hypothetical protein